MLVIVPSGESIFQNERILDSPLSASEVNSSSGFADAESFVTT
jgi:hypothetical protein